MKIVQSPRRVLLCMVDLLVNVPSNVFLPGLKQHSTSSQSRPMHSPSVCFNHTPVLQYIAVTVQQTHVTQISSRTAYSNCSPTHIRVLAIVMYYTTRLLTAACNTRDRNSSIRGKQSTTETHTYTSTAEETDSACRHTHTFTSHHDTLTHLTDDSSIHYA